MIDNFILLWCVSARMLVSCSLLCKKISHRKKFPSIVNPNIGYIGIKMGFDKREEIGKEMLGFTFMMHIKSPSEARKIIHNSKKYRAPEREGTLYGPQISEWSNSKGLMEEIELFEARVQTSQILFDSKARFNKVLAMKSNLDEDWCPSRRCHKVVHVTSRLDITNLINKIKK